MADPSTKELFQAVIAGDDAAFERVYDRYQQRVRLIAWRLSHRADWVDDLLNESWCRAFRSRKTYNPDLSFPSWFGGILQNVYREHCRKSPTTLDGDGVPDGLPDRFEGQDPKEIAAEAELLAELNDCLTRLDPTAARIVRMRFFDESTLRSIAKEVTIPESTIREVRLPAAFDALRRCLQKKGVPLSDVFPAQRPSQSQ